MNRFNFYVQYIIAIIILAVHFNTSLAENSSHNEEASVAWGLYCPDDVTINCTTNTSDLSNYGWAYVHDYSGYTYLYNPEVSYHLSSCNTGYITRTWSAYNPYGNYWHSCTQTIHVNGGYGGSFGYANIHWPTTPYTLEGCDPDVDPYDFPTEYGPPTFDYVACSQVGVSYNDVLFTVNSTCKKIIRKWKVIDWCQYEPYTGAGLWSFDQTIKIMDNVAPIYTCPEDITVSSTNCTDALVQVDPVTVDPASCGGYYSVTNLSPYAYSDGADISGVYPVGTTRVKVLINYGCGYRKSCWVEITVKKDKPPTPYCLHTIITALMPVDTDSDGVIDDGMVEIWAEDLDKGSKASCNNGPLEFSFSSDVTDKSKIFTCANAGTNQIEVWVTDRYGNQDWCMSNVVVQNNGANIPNCEPFNYTSPTNREYTISGRLTNLHNDPIGIATLELVDLDTWVPNYSYDTSYIITTDTVFHPNGGIAFIDNAEMVIEETLIRPIEHPAIQTITNEDGLYIINEAMANQNSYMVHSVGQELAEGILDYNDAHVLIRHILGLHTFNSPYQYIAADINMDQQINMKDFTALFNHIKHGSILTERKSWVLVDDKYSWEEPHNALTYCPEDILINEAETSVHDADFRAIQLGDLTNGNNPNAKSELSRLLITASDEELRSDLEREILTLRAIATDLLQVSSLSVYPNPFSNELTILLDSNQDDNLSIHLYTINGQQIYQDQRNVIKGLNKIALHPNINYKGMLLYEVAGSQGIFTGRLIKQ